MTGLSEFLKNNLLHVAPIILIGIFGLAIILERIKALYFTYPIKNEEGFFEKIREMVLAGEISETVTLCDKHAGKPIANVVKKGLLRAHQPENLVENGLELAIEDASQKISKRTGYLSMIANVATLLGLLGTIGGLVKSFQAVGTADAAAKSVLLAQGIAEAMYATMFGLGVAIPCMIAFSFLMNRTNRLTSNIESTGVRVMDILKQRYFAAESKTSTSSVQPAVKNPTNVA